MTGFDQSDQAGSTDSCFRIDRRGRNPARGRELFQSDLTDGSAGNQETRGSRQGPKRKTIVANVPNEEVTRVSIDQAGNRDGVPFGEVRTIIDDIYLQRLAALGINQELIMEVLEGPERFPIRQALRHLPQVRVDTPARIPHRRVGQRPEHHVGAIRHRDRAAPTPA